MIAVVLILTFTIMRALTKFRSLQIESRTEGEKKKKKDPDRRTMRKGRIHKL